MRIREIIDLIESTNAVTESLGAEERTFYHVTLSENLGSIMEKGLTPTVGDRSKKLKERSCVFLFPDQASAEDALSGWLGDQFDDDDDTITFALLEVTLPPEIEVNKTDGIDWEWYTRETIPPSCIRILSRDF
jgi:hypothetical protein